MIRRLWTRPATPDDAASAQSEDETDIEDPPYEGSRVFD